MMQAKLVEENTQRHLCLDKNDIQLKNRIAKGVPQEIFGTVEAEKEKAVTSRRLKNKKDVAVAIDDSSSRHRRKPEYDERDRYLMEQQRLDDPLYAYFQQKKMKQEAKEGKVTKPKYRGPCPGNRFKIPPGHRWDGVDRSNEFEKRWFQKQNEKRSLKEDTKEWSFDDM